jgi:nucleotide-binding universal stress UspA family protein
MASYRSVVVGTDGSRTSFVAVDRAAEVAHDAGAELVLVCAYLPADDRTRRQAERELGENAYQVSGSRPADDLLAEAEGRAASIGVKKIRREAVQGDPVDVLVQVIERQDADLVVVGNRGLNTLAGRLLGSVPANISHRARCDVLIVHTTPRGR